MFLFEFWKPNPFSHSEALFDGANRCVPDSSRPTTIALFKRLAAATLWSQRRGDVVNVQQHAGLPPHSSHQRSRRFHSALLPFGDELGSAAARVVQQVLVGRQPGRAQQGKGIPPTLPLAQKVPGAPVQRKQASPKYVFGETPNLHNQSRLSSLDKHQFYGQDCQAHSGSITTKLFKKGIR